MKKLFCSCLALMLLTACTTNSEVTSSNNNNTIKNNIALSFLQKLPADSKFNELSLEDHCAYLQKQSGSNDPFANFNYYIEQDDNKKDQIIMDINQSTMPFLGQGGSYIAMYNQEHKLDGLCFKSSLQNFENANMALAMYYDALKIRLGLPKFLDYNDGFASFNAMWELNKSGYATKYISLRNESVIINDSGYEKNYGQHISLCVLQSPLHKFNTISNNKINYANERIEQINTIVNKNTAQNNEQIIQAKKQILNLLEL